MIYSLGAIRLGGMGAATNTCDQYLENVATYTRLAAKTDKTAETRKRAADIAAENQRLWNASCSPAAIAAKAAAKTVATQTAATVASAITSGNATDTAKQIMAAAAANPEVAKALNSALAPLGVSIQTQSAPAASSSTKYILYGLGAVALIGAAWYFTRKKKTVGGVKP